MAETYGELLRRGARLLSFTETATLDARLLMQFAASFSHEQLILAQPEQVPETIVTDFIKLIERRASGEPVDHITGSKEFWSREFFVNHDVLTPRPDTEIIIEQALAIFAEQKPHSILDLGTGSGCLIVTLLNEFPNGRGLATDISDAALAIAKRNADSHGVSDRLTLLKQSFTFAAAGKFCLIVSNPPYIATDEALPDEVKNFDPALALFGGQDGLDAYRAILAWCMGALAEQGVCLFETGFNQADAVTALIRESLSLAGQEATIIRAKDLENRDRMVGFRLK